MSDTFFHDTHERYAANIRGEHNLVTYSCQSVARKMAMLFRGEGRQPVIAIIEAEEGSDQASLFPIPYGGLVEWGKHFVCTVDGVVYDPMMLQPMLLEEYLGAAFDQQVVVATEY